MTTWQEVRAALSAAMTDEQSAEYAAGWEEARRDIMTADLHNYPGFLIEVWEIQGKTMNEVTDGGLTVPIVAVKSGKQRWRALEGFDWPHVTGDLATDEITGWYPVSYEVHQEPVS